MTAAPQSNPLEVGDLLVERGVLSPKLLELVRRRQARLGIPQHRAIVELNYASEEDTYRALAQLHGLPFEDVSALEVPAEVLQEVPLKLIFHYRMLPLRRQEELLTVAVSEPLLPMEQGNLRLMLHRPLAFVISTPSAIQAALRRHFGLGAETIQQLRDERGSEDTALETVFDVKPAEEDPAVQASIARLVDQILMEALRLDATDIHLEPYSEEIRLRYRIDGVLQTIPVPAGLRKLHAPLVSRLKIMAGLNIAEKRLPQDGRIAMKTGGGTYDLRVSVLPTCHGEALCLRVLGRQSLFLDLAQLGMEPDQEAIMRELTQLPQGMVLLTGPTGSGKTTTLYAALTQANDEGRKIITLENPVEYQLPGIAQIQTREEIGLTFASGLRSILRHDPDVILIGEIRDPETAEIAMRAAQTGHLVFSTLHTNDSVTAVTRLLEMGVEPSVLGSSLVACVAQRLAQRICRHCMEPDPAVPAALREEMARTLGRPESALELWRGRGCVECRQRGYRGRIGLFEFFVLNEDIADLIEPGVKAGRLREAARRYGWRSLREIGWFKVQQRLITVAELHRLTRRLQVGQS
ncbi:MAG: GspE/PulE family protein [Verrucomicrobiota bacterium]|nr:GspE/PulE family protein [Limisphaera sp.]MDW8382372.1 GspE/PulE family protein [Verrucomicrobiota bacterium]